MSGAPGSIGWLFRHELRLLWYGAGSGKPGKSQRRPGLAGLALAGLAWLALHAIAFQVVGRSTRIDMGDPRVRRRINAVIDWVLPYVAQGTGPYEWSAKNLRKVFGNTSNNALSRWLMANVLQQTGFYRVGGTCRRRKRALALPSK